MSKFFKFVFYISVLFLIIISLYPGSLFGYLFYDDWSQQPNLIKNPFGTTINHFVSFVYISLFAFFLYSKAKNFQKTVYGMFFLSIALELLHLIIPNRSFELGDLIANISGVIVAYSIVKIYLYFNKI